jgi:hypothetical protein
MISGNGMPAASDCDEGMDLGTALTGKQGRDDASQPLRYIQNLIAKLEVVNRQLSIPLRARPMPWPEETGIPETAET